MQRYLVECNANHGGVFRASRESDAVVHDTRAAVADFLGAARPECIVFGQNMTSLTMHISRSLALGLSPGDEVVVTRLDHDANVAPWLLAARDRGCTVRWVDFDPAECSWSVEELSRQVTPKTRIVAVGYASNAAGTINPVAEAVRIAHAVGAVCVVDAVHYAPHGPIDVEELGCDILVCSAYKFFGPHTGHPLREVGPAGQAVCLQGPARREMRRRTSSRREPRASNPSRGVRATTGTSNGSEETFGRKARAREGPQGRAEGSHGGDPRARIRALACASRGPVGSRRGFGCTESADPAQLHRRVPTFAFTLEGRHPRGICEALDKAGISAWHGNYYARETTIRLGLEDKGGMVRVGAVHYTTREEIDRLCAALRSISRTGTAGLTCATHFRVLQTPGAFARSPTRFRLWIS